MRKNGLEIFSHLTHLILIFFKEWLEKLTEEQSAEPEPMDLVEENLQPPDRPEGKKKMDGKFLVTLFTLSEILSYFRIGENFTKGWCKDYTDLGYW